MGNTLPPEATPRNGVLLVVAIALLSQLPTTVQSIANPASRALLSLGAGLLLLVAGYFMTPKKKPYELPASDRPTPPESPSVRPKN